MSMFEILKEVFTSWQVIATTIAIILYLNIVFYVSRRYHRPRSFKIKFKAKKKSEPAAILPAAEEIPSGSDNDELGLEES